MSLHLDQPVFLWLLALALPIVLLGRGRMLGLDTARRYSAIGLRLFVLLLIVLILAGLHTVRKHDDLTLVAIVDESESVRRLAKPPAALPGVPAPSALPSTLPARPQNTPNSAAKPTDIQSWIKQYLSDASSDRKPDDRFGLVTFDGRATLKALPSTLGQVDSGVVTQPTEGTDLASAIRLAMAVFPPDSGKRIVLASDGNETEGAGQALAAAREAKAAGVPIDVLPVEYRIKHEVVVEGVYAPTEAREGQTVAVRIALRGTEPAPGLLYVSRDGIPLENTTAGVSVRASDWVAQDTATGGGFVAVISRQVKLSSGGVTRFSAVFEPSAGHDTLSANNRGQTVTLVHGRGRVLVATNDIGSAGSELPAALRSGGVEVEQVAGYALPAELAGTHRYDAIVLQDVPAEQVTPAQQEMLANYVTELGGGLLMVGGPNSFGAGGWANSPVDRVLPVDCSLQSLKIIPAGALVIVLDHSGSMTERLPDTDVSKMVVANKAAMLAIGTLYPQDYVGVLVFDDVNDWIVPLARNSDPRTTMAKVRAVEARGGTVIPAALAEGVDAFRKFNDPGITVRHIILLTDGYSESGDYDGILAKARNLGITVSTIGVGGNVDAALLQSIASKGGGNFYPVNDSKRLPQVFVKEARTIRKNLIKEALFTPRIYDSGSPLLAGTGSLPNLAGMVLTGNKGGGDKPDPRVFMPLTGLDNAPLLAHWQIGLGQTAAFTSDATRRWAQPWMSWPGYDDFWIRTVRTISRAATSPDLELAIATDRQSLKLKLEATASPDSPASNNNNNNNSNARSNPFAAFSKVVGSIVMPDGSTKPVSLKQTGPGTYEALAPAPETGSYLVSLFATDSTGKTRAVHGGVSRVPGPELRVMASNRALLVEIASITGGRVLDPANAADAKLFRRENPIETRSLKPVWRQLLAALLLAIIMDVATRRIAWDWVSIVASVQRKIDNARAMLAGRETHATATLGALRKRAEIVGQRLSTTPSSSSSQQRSTSSQSTASSSSTFDAAEPPSSGSASASTSSSASSSSSIAALRARRNQQQQQQPREQIELEPDKNDPPPLPIASKPDKPASTSPTAKPPAPAQEPGPTTSRLLDAKRRAREKLDDKET
jgi:Ca-activated chloride channel homolog